MICFAHLTFESHVKTNMLLLWYRGNFLCCRFQSVCRCHVFNLFFARFRNFLGKISGIFETCDKVFFAVVCLWKGGIFEMIWKFRNLNWKRIWHSLLADARTFSRIRRRGGAGTWHCTTPPARPQPRHPPGAVSRHRRAVWLWQVLAVAV